MDYPGRISLVLFTSGCNLNCPYCHNPELRRRQEGSFTIDDVIKVVSSRTAIIDGIVVTGGEPTLHGKQLVSFLSSFKEVFPSLQIKVDSNGSNPGVLEALRGVADMIAVDLKTIAYERYLGIELSTVLRSLEVARSFTEHEVRITMYPDYVDAKHPEEFCAVLDSSSVVAVQQCYLDGRPANTPEVVEEFAEGLQRCVKEVRLRL